MARSELLGGRCVCRDAESAGAAGACVEAGGAEGAACAFHPSHEEPRSICGASALSQKFFSKV